MWPYRNRNHSVTKNIYYHYKEDNLLFQFIKILISLSDSDYPSAKYDVQKDIIIFGFRLYWKRK